MRLKWNRMMVVPLLIAGIGLWLLWPHSSPKAGWFDDNWMYRVAISIGNTGSADSNKKVKLDIDTAALITANKIQSDCGDSRFTDASGKLLHYYIDTAGGACNTNSTDYYVLMESIPAGGSIIYHYYGNTTAANGTEAAQFSQATFTPNSGPTAASEEQSTGPVLSWSMNEGTGATLNDNTLNANIGTLGTTTSAPTWTTSDLCVEGSCLKFDGSNDYVSKTYSSDTELNPGTASFSVNAWFKHSSTQAGTDVLISRVDGADANGIGYKIYMDSSGFICFGIDQTAGSFPVDSACSTTSYADSKWHQVSGVKNGTTSIILYIDGQQIAADTSITSTTISGSSPAFRVGIDNGFVNPWDGFIDAVKVYPYARSADQVKTDFTARGSVNGVGTQMGNSDMNKNLSNGLVGYWKLDESTADTCAGGTNDSCDSSGNLNDGAWTNGATFTTVARFGNAVTLDGTNDYINVADKDSLSPTDITLSTWIKMTALPSVAGEDEMIMRKSHGSSPFNAYHWYVRQSDNKLRFEWYQSDGSSNNITGSTALTAGTWYHVVFSKTGTTGRIFINGVVDVEVNTMTDSTYNSSGPLRIGSNGSTANFYGQIDESRIYNRGLSPSEVAALYNYAPGPLFYYPLEEKSGTIVYDKSGNSHNGSISNPSSTNSVPGKFGNGFSNVVSGQLSSSDYLTTLYKNGSYTWSGWFHPDLATRSSYDLFFQDGNTASFALSFTGNLFELFWDTSGNNIICSSPSGLYPVSNNWYFAAFVYDGSVSDPASRFILYINGVKQVLSCTTSGTITDIVIIAAATIGNGGNYGIISGIIDEVRLYNYVRTSAQIIEDMNGGHPIGGSPIGSQVGYWKFDEGNNTTAYDASPNANDLTLSTATSAWTLSGKYGRAWDGNASRYVSRADDDDFDFAAADDFTLSAWIKTDGTASGTQYILNKSSATSQGYGIYGSSSGKVVFAIDSDTTWTPTDQAQSTTNVFDQAWHYIAARKTGTSKIDIFVDGRLEGSDTSLGATGSLSNAVSFYVGDRDGTDNGDEFNGDVDEVKIYRGALTNEQIKLDYNQGQSTVMGAASTASDGITADNSSARAFCVPGDTSTCNPPIGEWKMDENTGTTSTADTSGNNNNAAFNGSIIASQWTQGKKGSALSFDGANDYIQADNATLYDMGTTTPFTISGWFKSNSAGTTQNIFMAINNTSNYYRIQLNGGFLRAQLVNTGGSTFCTLRTNTSTVDDGKWHYFAALFNRNASCTTSDIVIYIDGQKETTTVASSGLNSNVNLDETGIRIGGNSAFFNGPIDTIRLYDYIRTPAQINWEYNQGGPVAWYRFDECQGTTAYDSSPNNNFSVTGYNGTITIGATGSNTSAGTCTGAATEAWKNGVNGKIKSSLSFDGTSDYVSITETTHSAFDFASGDTMTISAWIKPTALPSNGNYASIVAKAGASSNGYYAQISSSGGLEFCVINTGGTFGCYTSTQSPVTVGIWQHIVYTMTIGDSTSIKLYYNGKPVTGNWNSNGNTVPDADNANVNIGASDPTGEFFNGQIDDVRIYRYALTDTQIKTVMNNNSAVNFAPITGSP